MANVRTSSSLIDIWGGPGSGKTTYLGALDIASKLEGGGRWLLVGRDRDFPGSTRFLAQTTSMLLRECIFPIAGVPGATPSYGYSVNGRPNDDMLDRLSRLAAVVDRRPIDVSFKLTFQDHAGGDFLSYDPDDPLWAQLARCHGLIYLYDPTVAPEDNLRYLQAGLSYVYQNAEHAGSLLGTSLPHFIALCLSKYDEPNIIRQLRGAGLLNLEGGVPQVKNPQRAFELLAGDLVANMARFFLPERICYFATSSIGFYTADPQRLDLGDCYNITEKSGSRRIRGPVRPVNVFTPLYWLARSIDRAR